MTFDLKRSLRPLGIAAVCSMAAGSILPSGAPITAHAQETAVESSQASTVGIASEKPAEGPSVDLGDGRFMVPYTEKIPGTDITFEMIPVPGGKFTMGSPEDEDPRADDEGPTVEINVSPMWVAKTETTWEMYKEYMRMYAVFKSFEADGIRTVDESNQADSITAPTELYDPSFTYEYGEEPEQPAVTMTQYAAQQFTKWLSLITDNQYRLPTEAEWEYAARGGTQTAYSWGDSADDIEEYAWYFDNSYDGPAHVGTKKPNPFGLHDMHGNAAEWTVNEYSEEGYQWLKESPVDNAIDAVRWPENPWPCVARGGSWESDPPELRSAARLASDDDEWKNEDPNFPKSPWWFTDDPSRGVGFRLFRSLEPLGREALKNFWEPTALETVDDVESRISGGRGGWGLVDKDLPEAAKE
ncbi:formylglycine-generating enzyme family protein [Rhodopirellula baltica]|uniref:Formylglycine-generating sulfatase n=1 Tax=Rhodopirellula baltica WH47 TaxID=991778 RepID=F2ARD6_RHOBT|nr:formylglycine-generating enzyme family protein [Rhodopirellula baltica]EGF27754.1 Formylglycine-generating sulfatase [Rhodopirellula baltica WH47]